MKTPFQKAVPRKRLKKYKKSWIALIICLHEDYSKEEKRFFDQKEKERLANLQNQESSDQEDSSLEEDDPNTRKFHQRICERFQGNFFRSNLQPTFLNTARRNLESKKPYNAENYGWLMVLGKTHPCFDYHKFFKTYPEAFKQIYQLRDFMKCCIVEWDNKDPSDPIKRMELELKAETKQVISNPEQKERPVNEQQGNSIKDISSFENQVAVTEVKMDRIQIEPLIPEKNGNATSMSLKMNQKKKKMDF